MTRGVSPTSLDKNSAVGPESYSRRTQDCLQGWKNQQMKSQHKCRRTMPPLITPGEAVLLLEFLDHTPATTRYIQQWTRHYQYSCLKGKPIKCPVDVVHISAATVINGRGMRSFQEQGANQGKGQVVSALHKVHAGTEQWKALSLSYVWWHNYGSQVLECTKGSLPLPSTTDGLCRAPLHSSE